MLPEFLLTLPMLVAPLQEIPKAEARKEEPPQPRLIPPEKEGGLPCDSKDHQSVLMGATTREAILAHREIFRDNMRHRYIKPEWMARWKAIDVPCTLVVAFGSWCSDSQRELPEFLALTKETNPFVTIRYIGVYRDKKADAVAWPKNIEPQAIDKVPTFWLFELQPNGGQKLIGSIVETPPKKDQGMAEAVLDLLASAR